MRVPGFTAEVSLYKGSQRYYRTGAAGSTGAIQVVPQIPPGPITRCGSCRADAASPTGYSRVCCTDGDCETRSCTPPPPCPQTTCQQDPATTNPLCQICYTTYCDGTMSVYHTC
jgi:hypothetical protein